MSRVLTPDAELDRAQFNRDFKNRGCTCFISPPCSHCMHPGNPANQDEDEAVWVEQFDLEEMVASATSSVSLAIDFAVMRNLREMRELRRNSAAATGEPA